MKILFLTTIFLVISFSVQRRRKRKSSANIPIKYYTFALQWPSGTCKETKCNMDNYKMTPNNSFTLHGLWPDGEGKTYPQNCDSSSEFLKDEEEVPIMNSLWPSLFNMNNDDFWSHEWSKHGTCWALNYTGLSVENLIQTQK